MKIYIEKNNEIMKYVVRKTRLTRVINNTNLIDTINSYVKSLHILNFHTTHFLNFYARHEWENNPSHNEHDFAFTKDTIVEIYNLFLGNHRKIDNKKRLFWRQKFIPIIQEYMTVTGISYNVFTRVHSRGLHDYESIKIMTSISNHIETHYENYVNRFVNQYFKTLHQQLLSQFKKHADTEEYKKYKQELWSSLSDVKSSLLGETLETKLSPIYTEFITQHKPYLVDTTIYSIKDEHHRGKYQKSLIYISSQMTSKRMAIIPVRKATPSYVSIDTAILAYLVQTKVPSIKESLWIEHFNTHHKTFKQKKYIFDTIIDTDGYGISVHLIHEGNVEKKNIKKQSAYNAKKATDVMKKKLSKEDYLQWKEMKNTQKVLDKKQQEQRKKDKRNHIKEKNKKDSTLVQTKTTKKTLSVNQIEELNIPSIYSISMEPVSISTRCCEFPYFNDPLRGIHTVYKSPPKVFGINDPGMRDPICIINQDFNYKDGHKETIHYSARQIQHERGDIKRQVQLRAWESRVGIHHSKLSDTSKKTIKLCEYTHYLKLKVQNFNDSIDIYYKDVTSRSLRWKAYMSNRVHMTNMCKNIYKTITKDEHIPSCKDDRPPILYGDWSRIGRKGKGVPPVRSVGMLRKLKEFFHVFLIDEYGTSSRHYKNFRPMESIKVRTKKGTTRTQHSILTYKGNLSTGQSNGFFQRDRMACVNMKSIVIHHMRNGTRHPGFLRKVNSVSDTHEPAYVS